MSRAVEILHNIVDAFRVQWSADADFTSRNTLICGPRVRHHQADSGREYVDVQHGPIEFESEISSSPQVNALDGSLLFYGIVDGGARTDPLYLGDAAAAAILDRLTPLAILLERKIDGTLRAISQTVEEVRFWQFVDYSPLISAEGGRLRGAARFRYSLSLIIEASVEDETLEDLETAGVDYTLEDGGAAPPHAEDEIDLT